MRRIAVVTGLFVVVALGVAGCGAAAEAQELVEARALTAIGFAPDEIAPDEIAPDDGPDAAPSAGPVTRPRQALKRTLHGEVVVQTKDGDKTVLVQRGEVTALDDDGITVKSSDGFTLTWTFAEKLRVIERRSTVAADALAVGDQVGVAGAAAGEGAGTARLIVIPRAR